MGFSGLSAIALLIGPAIAASSGSILETVTPVRPGTAKDAQTSSAARQTEVIALFEASEINWTRHVWRVTGKSLPVSPALSVGGPIRQAGGSLALARADALQRLHAVILHMLQGSVVSRWLGSAGSPAQTQRALKVLDAGAALSTQFFADGHVVWTGEFAWDHSLAEILSTIRAAAPVAGQGPWGGQGATRAFDAAVPNHPTGLVVDARGLRVRPCLFFALHQSTGRVLYDMQSVTPHALAAFGVARYFRSFDAALKDERVGEHPAVVRAQASFGADACALVLEDREAATVAAAFTAVQDARVIVVIGPDLSDDASGGKAGPPTP